MARIMAVAAMFLLAGVAQADEKQVGEVADTCDNGMSLFGAAVEATSGEADEATSGEADEATSGEQQRAHTSSHEDAFRRGLEPVSETEDGFHLGLEAVSRDEIRTKVGQWWDSSTLAEVGHWPWYDLFPSHRDHHYPWFTYMKSDDSTAPYGYFIAKPRKDSDADQAWKVTFGGPTIGCEGSQFIATHELPAAGDTATTCLSFQKSPRTVGTFHDWGDIKWVNSEDKFKDYGVGFAWLAPVEKEIRGGAGAGELGSLLFSAKDGKLKIFDVVVVYGSKFEGLPIAESALQVFER